MGEDGDRMLTLIGFALVGFLVLAVVVGLFAVVALSPDDGGPPDADWVLNRVNDTHVQVGHAGGETVADEHLLVTVDGTERAASFPDQVSRGDAGIVPAAAGQTVRLYWTGGDDRELLEEWTVEDPDARLTDRRGPRRPTHGPSRSAPERRPIYRGSGE